MVKQNIAKPVCCSTRQKIYGIIALVGLFACGVMIGVAINGGGRVKESDMAYAQCQDLMMDITMLNYCRSDPTDDCIAKLNSLTAVFAKNCAGRTFEVDDPKPAQNPENTADKKTCEVIEDLLKDSLSDENDNYPGNHERNIDVYKKLVKNGCPENTEKYQALILREQEILAALTGQASSENTQTCAEIERLLAGRVVTCGNYRNAYHAECYINNAKIYANMSERGCPENSQKYVDLAAKELEIARALQDDKFSESDTIEVVETYKRLEMKQAANEILDKVQKLTDPAIDFILQVQKIIEE